MIGGKIEDKMDNRKIAFILIFLAGIILLGQSVFNFWIATFSSKFVGNNIFLLRIGTSQAMINYVPPGVGWWNYVQGVWYSLICSLFSGAIILLLDFLFIRRTRAKGSSGRSRRWFWVIIILSIINMLFFAWYWMFYYVILIGIGGVFGIAGSIIGLVERT